MRLFIALPAPEPVRAAAGAVASRLRGVGEVSWVPPERLHVTLKFLGEVLEGREEEIESALAETANKFSQFVVQCGGIGAFPTPRRPRIVWLGLSGEGAARLIDMAGRLDRRLTRLGFSPEERPFQPHLTIGRVKGPKGIAELTRRLDREKRESREMTDWPVDELHLVRSVLGPAGRPTPPWPAPPSGPESGPRKPASNKITRSRSQRARPVRVGKPNGRNLEAEQVKAGDWTGDAAPRRSAWRN